VEIVGEAFLQRRMRGDCELQDCTTVHLHRQWLNGGGCGLCILAQIGHKTDAVSLAKKNGGGVVTPASLGWGLFRETGKGAECKINGV